MTNLNITVVGAGVVGLTTALELQQEFRGAKVNVLADKFSTETTSFVAAGLFRPGTSFTGPNEELTHQWIADAFEYWTNLVSTKDGINAGVTEASGYIFSSTDPSLVRNQFLEKIVPVYRAATQDELSLCPGNWKYGSFFATVLTDCSRYLPWAERKFTAQGGNIFEKKLNSFSDITSDNDVIVNCSGFGAKYLCDDRKVVPIRGQVLKVEAPWVKTFFYGDYDTYVIPGIDSVTLGGVRQYDSYKLEIDKYDYQSIKERCEKLLPSLKNAKLLGQRVGLRPHRDPARVETEMKIVNGRRLKIVHNYGHGGYGVTTAPGTSLYAVKLVRQILSGNSKL